ncbi:MAG: tetratricopeptide repeat protein [Candidatus Izemoplasmatales bacterium]
MEELERKIHQDKIPLKPDGLLNMHEVESTFKTFLEEKKYQEALNYLNQIKNDTHLVNHKDILKLHDLYIEILLIIEDFKSLENILKSKSKYIETRKEENLHQFYLAICYEGLDEIEKAIKALEQIEDTISSKNLTNKYLKLALLYIQSKDLKAAKKAYEHALLFDRQKENDIFMLVESDIEFYEKNYIDSMKLFEDFFIKTKRKLSYLNRFIKISLALNRQNDAYEFYKRYKEKILNHESIQVKLSFFNTAIDFLKTIDQEEYIEANNYLSILKQREIIDFDDFDYFKVILKHLKKHKIYQKEREVIRDLFIDLNQTNAFKKLVYLEVKNAELHIYHFSKDLLLEKTIENNHLITDDILSQQYKQSYPKEMIENFIFVEETVDYIMVESLDQQRFLLTYVSENQFDLAKKLTILSKHLLMDKLNDFHIRKKEHNQFISIKELLSKTDYGLIRISQNQVYMLNEKAKTILKFDETILDFNQFQKNLEPMIYIDDLYHQEKIHCQFKDDFISLMTHPIDNDLYVLLAYDNHQDKKLQLTQLKADESTSLMIIDIDNHHELIAKKTRQAYQAFIEEFKRNLHKYSNHHIDDLFFQADHLFYILLDTRDKRIPERLLQKLRSEYKQICEIRGTYHPLNMDINSILQRLHEMLALTNKNQKDILSYKNVKLDHEIRHTYLQTIQNLLNHKNITLTYHYIKDWRQKTVKYIDVGFNNLDILKDKDLLASVLTQNQLHLPFDRLIVNQLIHDLKEISFHSRWILPISNQSIESKKAFNYLMRRLSLIKDHQIIIKLSLDSYLKLSKDDKGYLKDKAIDLCIEGLVENLKDLSIYDKNQLLMIDHNVYDKQYMKPILPWIQNKVKDIIYNHKDQTLKKTDLESKKIFLVKGDYSGHTENLNQE